jgi:hypothetical protein
MKTYTAIGKAQYFDQSPQLETRTFKAENDSAARTYIINHFDCSRAWEYFIAETEGA